MTEPGVDAVEMRIAAFAQALHHLPFLKIGEDEADLPHRTAHLVFLLEELVAVVAVPRQVLSRAAEPLSGRLPTLAQSAAIDRIEPGVEVSDEEAKCP